MEDVIAWVVAIAIGLISWGWERYKQSQRDKAASAPAPAKPEPVHVAAEDRAPRHLPTVTIKVKEQAPAPAMTVARMHAFSRADELRKLSEQLLEVARVDWATMRIARTLEDFVLPRVKLIRAEAERLDELALEGLDAPMSELEMVYGVIREMIEQRRHPRLGKDLGDVDAMAIACYQPIIDYAQADGIRLTSSTPVAMLQPNFDLAIWTGFIPTGIAPLFLPPDLVKRALWWPALAHEVGHDFLAASPGAEDGIRMQLGLPSETEGLQFLDVSSGTLEIGELVRVLGGWFEELFCDVFGTLMIGPAYSYSMLELFSTPQEPEAASRVLVDPSGQRLDPHPPRFLRLLASTRVLDQVGEFEHAEKLRTEWTRRHGEVPTMAFPARGGGEVTVPVGVVDDLVSELATRLYSEPMYGLDGHALYNIPGLDYGPHEAAEVQRVCDELLNGQVPAQHGARFVIGGVVLARIQARHKEHELVALAHRAIVGVTEHRETVLDHVRDRGREPGAEALATDDKRAALVLHTVLGPPLALQHLARARGLPAARSLVTPRHRRWRS